MVRVELPEVKKRGKKPLFMRVNILDNVNNVRISGKRRCKVTMGWKSAILPKGKEWHIQLVQGKKLIETKGSKKGVVKNPVFPVVFSQKVKGGFVTVNGLPYRGRVKVKRVGLNSLLVINELPVEQYLRSVVPSEIGDVDSTTLEAAKAQAVAARTYAVANLGKHKAFGYDVVATTGDQVYSGVIRESRLTDRAVSETAGIIAMYRGRPIKAVYHSTCGGHTSSNEDSWFGSPVRYLQARPDYIASLFHAPEPFCRDSPMYEWRRSWNKKEFERMVKVNLVSIIGRPPKGRLNSVRVVKRDRYDRVTSVEVKTTEAKYRVEKGRIRKLFSDPKRGWVDLPSTNFRIRYDGRRYTMSGKGWGHGVGMCQWGAIGMSRKGYTYDRILKHYYKGIYLARIY